MHAVAKCHSYMNYTTMNVQLGAMVKFSTASLRFNHKMCKFYTQDHDIICMPSRHRISATTENLKIILGDNTQFL